MAARKTQERIPAKELREYMKLPVDQALSKPGEEVRILPDGRVIRKLVAVRGVDVWPSREAYVEWWQNAEEDAAKARAAPPPAQTLLPPIDDFLRDVETHARSLGPRLRIPDEALGGTVASLDAVDKALKRIPWAKRQVPDLVTPLVAYVGEVMRRASGGRWLKTGRQEQVVLCDPDELLALWAAKRKLQPIAVAAAEKAAAEAKARGASAKDVERAYVFALQAIQQQAPALKSRRVEVHEDNDPVIMASNGRSFQPFAVVFVPMVEPSKRLPLRDAVETTLHVSGYPRAPNPAG